MFRGSRDHLRGPEGLECAEAKKKKKKKSQSSSRMARSYTSRLWRKEWEMRLKKLRVKVEDLEYWDKNQLPMGGLSIFVCVYMHVHKCH